MNEIDLGRLLPLVVLWIIWLLITRGRGRERPEIPVPQPAGENRTAEQPVPDDRFDFPPGDFGPAEFYRSAAVPFPSPARKDEVKPPLPAAKPAARRRPTVPGFRAGVSGRELRRLIVWSEILASPLGLRDKRRGE